MDKKRTIWQAVICVGLVCLIWGGYFCIRHYGIDGMLEIKEDDFSWVYQVDSVETNDGEVLLKGFAFELDKDAAGDNYEIVLQELETGKNYFLEMEYSERKDVNDYFLCEYDYLQSGFEAKIEEKKLDLLEKDYEVLLRRLGERKTYRTGTYLTEGQLIYTNPQEFVPLEVEGTDLEKIVEEGVLRVYRPDYGMYVYQYEGEIYWVAEPDYEFNEAGGTYVQWHLETSQIEKLPAYRLENQWYSDDLGFGFEEYELVEGNTGIYRVSKRILPVEYSIIQMNTGRYLNEWIWIQKFRPYYDFK